VDEIRSQDQDRSLDAFMLSVLDQYSIQVQDLADRTYRLGSAGVLADSFPGLPAEGFTVTCDRTRALAREDIQFLTWDHPLVTGALDLLLGSEKGNSSFAVWADSRQVGLYLEAVYLLECVAPPELHVDRFLPPTPVRVLVDQTGKASDEDPVLKSGDLDALAEEMDVHELIPFLIQNAEAIARQRVSSIVENARREMRVQLETEICRLAELKKVNRSVRREEIDLLATRQRALDQHLSSARLRLDAMRMIYRVG
jgi:ATP-dependent helicase HepA